MDDLERSVDTLGDNLYSQGVQAGDPGVARGAAAGAVARADGAYAR
jgi:hypothetical protein